jgi:NADPH-dependent 7-cyano-7-deazaguanine reductase QueF
MIIFFILTNLELYKGTIEIQLKIEKQKVSLKNLTQYVHTIRNELIHQRDCIETKLNQVKVY